MHDLVYVFLSNRTYLTNPTPSCSNLTPEPKSNGSSLNILGQQVVLPTAHEFTSAHPQNWHRLLSHLWGERRRGHRIGESLAQEGHEVHYLITYNQPVRLGSFHPGVFYHEVEVSKYPLFDYPPYELVLTSKMVEVAQNPQPQLAARALRHSSCKCRGQRQTHSRRGRVARARGHDPSWDGHHAAGQRRIIQTCDHPRHQRKRRSDRRVGQPQARHPNVV